MSTTEAIGTTDGTTTDERAEFVKGLRDLADFIESNPDAPTPGFVIACKHFSWGEGIREEFITGALALGTEVKVTNSRAEVERTFGPVKFSLEIAAKEICEEREITVPRIELVLPEELDPEVQEGKALAALDEERLAAQDDPRGEADR